MIRSVWCVIAPVVFAFVALTGCTETASPAGPPSARATLTTAIPDCLTAAPPTCYSPSQFATAYGITNLLNRGFDGRGETIVMPEFAVSSSSSGVTNVRQDLARYDSIFRLPPVHLQILTRFAGAGAPSLASGEEAGDIEIAHAVGSKSHYPRRPDDGNGQRLVYTGAAIRHRPRGCDLDHSGPRGDLRPFRRCSDAAFGLPHGEKPPRNRRCLIR